jgi:PAS domain-containing protein
MSDVAILQFGLLLGACGITAGAGVYVWLRVHVPGARAMALLLFACALTSGASALQFTTDSATVKVALEKLLTVGDVSAPVFWFVFALQYTGRGRYLTRTVLALLCAIPLVSLGLALSNDAHRLFWSRLPVPPGDPYMGLSPVYGPAFWVHVTISYALLAAGTVLLLRLFWRSWSLYRSQALALLAGVSIPWVADALYMSDLSPFGELDVSSMGFSVGALLIAWSLVRLRVGDVLAVSRTTILNSLPDAVLVLDPDAEVLYRNQAAVRFLERVSAGSVPEMLARVWPRASAGRADDAAGMVERASLTCMGEHVSAFDLQISSVVDGGGQALARVLVVRDVSEQRRVEEELRDSRAQLEQALDATVQALSAAVESRDPYTLGHQRRVAALSRAIAVELGMGPEQARGLFVAAEVHDVGKIQVPIDFLSRPGRLSEGEFAIVREHAEAGYQILKGVAFPWPVAQIVHQHHEKLDGSGYPLGLRGDDILLEARILCVADTVEAMASDRPYRPALGVDAALQEIARNRGRLFDPASVDACERVFARGDFAFPPPNLVGGLAPGSRTATTQGA